MDFTLGNKIQEETDFESKAMKFSRFYNSLDGLWRHNFSTRLFFSDRSAVMVMSDGKESLFSPSPEGYISDANVGILLKEGNSWRYNGLNNQTMFFSASGELTQINKSDGVVYKLTYTRTDKGPEITVNNSYGESLVIVEDFTRQLKSIRAGTKHIVFSYDAYENLSERKSTDAGIVSITKYHYESAYKNSFLTGITDARGVRFATWAYNDSGRPISSQHADNAGSVKIRYLDDGYRVVTNELGKNTTYRYENISGKLRLVQIIGEPSPNCPASNSSYTYNERGQVLTKTDAKGLITAYTYSERGLETSRTEASGTAQARTVITEWDPSRFLPTKITEPTRITAFTYDDQGRETGRQVTLR
ncbi:DUF6531 domain-containing protein [Pseudomonas amygdali]|uniref:DUF6531 domain-containing protein n=1 Tax=Pseudomonas amygdali TaxID=47877 RepID=UPI002285B23E|nr:DUF6531 domain-containing protein [Pseudomonas amygdali]